MLEVMRFVGGSGDGFNDWHVDIAVIGDAVPESA
jgi:hypothetical protein